MSLSKKEKPPISRDQIDILDFPTSFGELSPIEGFTGPKTPSRRQVLRFFLYLVADDHSLKDASDKVVSGILEKHPTSTIKPHFSSFFGLFWGVSMTLYTLFLPKLK